MKLSHCGILDGLPRIAKVEGRCYLLTPKAAVPLPYDVEGLTEGYKVLLVGVGGADLDDVGHITVQGQEARIEYRPCTQKAAQTCWAEVSDASGLDLFIHASAYKPTAEYAAIVSKLISERHVKRTCKAVLGLTKLTVGHVSVRPNGGGILCYIGGIIFVA
jgi:hypothetical protein